MILPALLGSTHRKIPPNPPPGATLTTIPTYEGSGNTIHPSVVDMGEPWAGYRYWMADTPYPQRQYRWENPSIFASNDKITWHVPPGVVNPLAPQPPSGWNSDTELVWDDENERMVAFWRCGYPTQVLHAAVSYDGAEWVWLDESPPIPDLTALTSHMCLSPSIARDASGLWKLMFFGGRNNPQIWTAADLLGPWTRTPSLITILAESVPRLWHGDMILYDGVWLSMAKIEGQTGVRLLSSLDLVSWSMTETDYPDIAAYRPTFVPSDSPGVFDVWYSTMLTLRVTYTQVPADAFPAPPTP